MLIFLLINLSFSKVVVFEKIISTETCDAMIDKDVKEFDNHLFELFSKYALEYLNHLKVKPIYKRDNGYIKTMFKDDKKESFVVLDPENSIFGAIIFLNDNVAGGSLIFEDQTITPECGKMVIFPATFAFPKVIERIKLGKMHIISTYFF